MQKNKEQKEIERVKPLTPQNYKRHKKKIKYC